MEVPDQAPHGHSNKPTFSQIAQALPEIWPKRWTEYSCCRGNVMKIHKPTSKNRDATDFMTVPDQPSHGHSNKSTFSQITQAHPEL